MKNVLEFIKTASAENDAVFENGKIVRKFPWTEYERIHKGEAERLVGDADPKNPAALSTLNNVVRAFCENRIYAYDINVAKESIALDALAVAVESRENGEEIELDGENLTSFPVNAVNMRIQDKVNSIFKPEFDIAGAIASNKTLTAFASAAIVAGCEPVGFYICFPAPVDCGDYDGVSGVAFHTRNDGEMLVELFDKDRKTIVVTFVHDSDARETVSRLYDMMNNGENLKETAEQYMGTILEILC